MPLDQLYHVPSSQNGGTADGSESIHLLEQNVSQDLILSWRNLSVKYEKDDCDSLAHVKHVITQKKCQKEYVYILKNVTGRSEKGQLTALLGSSGGGKTTLLAALGNRLKGEVEGHIYLNGLPVTRQKMVQVSGFVPQKNICFNTLTVTEHLSFMANFKMDRKIDAAARDSWINFLVTELGLSSCLNTVLGKISGGEMKRLMLAVELLTDPPVLLCDEPTTGLDSYSAQIIVQILRTFSARGKIVICSVHQLSSEVFGFFSHLILLADGQVAFHGTLHQASEFFNSLGYVCPDTYNPAEFYVKMLSIIPDNEDECLRNVRSICTEYSHSDFYKSLERLPDHSSSEFLYNTDHKADRFHCSWWSQFYWLMWRSMKDSRRSYFEHVLQIIMFLTTTTVIATFYKGIRPDSQEGMQDFRGLLYLLSSEMFFYSAYCVLYTFPYEIPIFLRESNLYSSSAYYISKVMSSMPRTVIETTVFFGFIFPMADFPVGGILGYFMLLGPLLLISIGALAYGCMMSAIFESYDMAAALTVPIDLISMLMAGIFFNLRSLPSRIIWLKYLSQFYYCNELLAITFWPHVHHINCPKNPELPCLHTGEEVLDQYGFNSQNIIIDIVILIGFFISLSMIGFIQIWRRSKKYSVY